MVAERCCDLLSVRGAAVGDDSDSASASASGSMSDCVAELEAAMCTHEIVVAGEKLVKPIRCEEAMAARDATAKVKGEGRKRAEIREEERRKGSSRAAEPSIYL